MSIDLTCSCGKRLQVADEYAGRQGRCPVCGRTFEIPDNHGTHGKHGKKTERKYN
jgi:hypothetical protein